MASSFLRNMAAAERKKNAALFAPAEPLPVATKKSSAFLQAKAQQERERNVAKAGTSPSSQPLALSAPKVETMDEKQLKQRRAQLMSRQGELQAPDRIAFDTTELERVNKELHEVNTRLEEMGKQGFNSRLNSVLSAGLKGTAAQFTNLGGLMVDTANEAVDLWESDAKKVAKQRADTTREILRTGVLTDGRPVTDAMRPALEEMLAKYEAEYAAAEEKQAFEERHPQLTKAEEKIYEAADKLDTSAEKDVQKAKKGLGAAGQFAVDAGVAATQLAGDIGLAALTGGSTVIPMAARVMGGSAQEARKEGADVSDQLRYGTFSALASGLTERLGNVGVFKHAFGSGVLDKAIAKIAQKPAGKLIASAASEGLEEFVESLAQPILKQMTYDPEAKYDEEWLTEALYGAAIGAVLGSGGAAVSPSTYGGKPAVNAQEEGVKPLAAPDLDAKKEAAEQPMYLKTAEALATERNAAGGQDVSGQNKSATPNKGEAAEVVNVLADNIPALQTKAPVATTSANVFREVQGNTMAEKARKLFESIKGIVTRQGLGDVEINGRSVKDDLSHGVGPAKAATISVIPQVIQYGEQIDFQQNWKGRGYDGYTFAAPVKMDGETVYVAAVVKKTNKNRFYLHEVVDSKGNIIKIDDEESANPTSLATNGDAGTQSASSDNRVAGNRADVNVESLEAPRYLAAPMENGSESMPASDGVRYLAGPQENTADAAEVRPLTGPATEESRVEALPTKAKEYLGKAERRLLNKLGNSLSVPKFVQRDFLQEIVRGMSEEYLKNGHISAEAMSDLFDQAYESGVQVETEFYDMYKDIKTHLRTQPITISTQDQADIVDYNDFRRSAFGTLRIVKDGGISPDVAYAGLTEMAPELFPASITPPADQLMRMYEVGRSIERVEKSLDEYYGSEAAEFKRWAKNDFEAAMGDALAEMQRVKRYAEEKAAKETRRVLSTPEEVKAAYKDIRNARKTAEKAVSKNLLTDYDSVQVGRLLKGEITLEDLDPEKVNVRGVKEVFEAKQEYERLNAIVKEYNRGRKAKLHEEVDADLATANEWKDKPAGILYSRETMERNFRDVVPDRETADSIIGKYITPVHTAQAESTRMKNAYRDRVRALNLSRKVAEGNEVSEAHAVQLLGEAEDNIRVLQESKGRVKERDGKKLEEWQAIVADLWQKNPNLDQAKVRGAVAEFRVIYDELFQQMNEVRLRNGYEPVAYRQGYFPHFQPGTNESLLDAFGKALGIETEVTALPTTINGLTHTFRPGITWFGHAQERMGFSTAYDAVEGFDKYIEGASDVIHQTDNIQRLRALTSQMRYRTSDEGIRKQVDAVMENDSLTEEDKQNRIDKIYESGRYTLSNFVVELEEYTNLLANKKSRADRNMEQAIGRRMYNLTKALENRVAANMVAINPASWLTNFIPITQGMATVDTNTMMQAMWKTLQSYKEDDGFASRSSFLTNRRGSDPIVRTWAQEASAKMSLPMEYIDQFTADTLVRARYQQNINRGLSETEAMSEADAWAAGVMADRSKGATPTLFNRKSPLTKLFTQFQLEVNNQLSYLFKDVPDELKEAGAKALAAGLLKFFIGSFLYNEVYEYVIGRRPALDPIGILNDTVGDLTGYELPNLVGAGADLLAGETPNFKTQKKDGYEAVKGLATATAEGMPFVGGLLGGGRLPISSALPDFANLGKAVFSDSWDDKKRRSTIAKELAAPATYLVAPFGGGQIKKIFQGLKAVAKGGSYSVDSSGRDIMQYPVFNDTAADVAGNAARAVLFGKSSLPTAQEWVEDGFDSYGAKQTAVYQGMNDAGVSDREAYALLEDLRAAKKTAVESVDTIRRRILRNSDISPEGKAVAYYGMLASEGEIAVMDALAETDTDMGQVTEVLMTLRDENLRKGHQATKAQRNALISAKLDEKTKRYIYQEIITDGKEEEIDSFVAVGGSFDSWLRFEKETAGLESDAWRTKKEKVLDAIDKMDLSEPQKDALYLAAGYSENTIDEAPWRISEYQKYSLKAPSLDLPDLNLPTLNLPELNLPELEVRKLPAP